MIMDIHPAVPIDPEVQAHRLGSQAASTLERINMRHHFGGNALEDSH